MSNGIPPNSRGAAEVIQAEELRPCPNPWCGKSSAQSHQGSFNLKWTVSCDYCRCCTPCFDTEGEAIAAWNKRAGTDPSPAYQVLREALEAMLTHYGPAGTLRDTVEYPVDHPISKARAALANTQAQAPVSTEQGDGLVERFRDRIGEGEFFVNGDTFDLIFRPGGGNYCGGDMIVARMACGETAYVLPALVATLLNKALTPAQNSTGEG